MFAKMKSIPRIVLSLRRQKKKYDIRPGVYILYKKLRSLGGGGGDGSRGKKIEGGRGKRKRKRG